VRFPDDTVVMYYGGSDTRCYAARTTVAKLVDWCLNTPEDGLTTRKSVEQRLALARANKALLAK
jgi:4-O-beta-D-mannosyl-D-glucose phosphorylase